MVLDKVILFTSTVGILIFKTWSIVVKNKIIKKESLMEWQKCCIRKERKSGRKESKEKGAREKVCSN